LFRSVVSPKPIRFSTFVNFPDSSKHSAINPRLRQLAEDVARHEFSIPIARTMNLQEIQGAHCIFERGGVNGKIVLVP
jgi:NADPH:quinone reductase-like Zn-dependent oxidoreductase